MALILNFSLVALQTADIWTIEKVGQKSYTQRTNGGCTEYRGRTEKPLTEAPLIVVPIKDWVEGANMF